MANKIAIYEGYNSPFEGYGRRHRRRRKSYGRRHRRGGGRAQRTKMGKCARHCKGKAGFKTCMRTCLRK